MNNVTRSRIPASNVFNNLVVYCGPRAILQTSLTQYSQCSVQNKDYMQAYYRLLRQSLNRLLLEKMSMFAIIIGHDSYYFKEQPPAHTTLGLMMS